MYSEHDQQTQHDWQLLDSRDEDAATVKAVIHLMCTHEVTSWLD